MMAVSVANNGVPLADLLGEWLAADELPTVSVADITMDSRQVVPGGLFLAVAGLRSHGLQHLDKALDNGAAAVVWEPVDGDDEPGAVAARCPVPAVALDQLSRRAGWIAHRFFGEPSRALFTAGVTGTDGKTSCTHFIAEALGDEDCPAGLMGTLGYGVFGELQDGGFTTPDAVTVHRELAGLRDRGVRHVAMEVSSHGMEQGRVSGVQFDAAVFTNLSRDHLDYHGNEQAYGEAKRKLFHTPDLGAAIINADDAFAASLLSGLEPGVQPVLYGMNPASEVVGDHPLVRGSDLKLSDEGLSLLVDSPWGGGELRCGLLGDFNAYNLLAAFAVLLRAGVSVDDALQRLSRVHTVPGRMERFGGGARHPLVVVDYAHTPRALEQVLKALRPHCSGELFCVFGAGGDRDQGKRPLMGRAAERLADRVIVTSDNPRSEAPAAIIDDILNGMMAADAGHVEADRQRAIEVAVQGARPGDVVLVAGKGHEDYQEVNGERLPFSDRAQVMALLREGSA